MPPQSMASSGCGELPLPPCVSPEVVAAVSRLLSAPSFPEIPLTQAQVDHMLFMIHIAALSIFILSVLNVLAFWVRP